MYGEKLIFFHFHNVTQTIMFYNVLLTAGTNI